MHSDIQQTIKKTLAVYKTYVKRRAKGALRHDYLVPSGYYEEQWDWDGFFIGMALASDIPSEAIYLRNWALNYIESSESDGYTPGCVSPKGPESGHRRFLMKPFLAQGAYLASRFLNDYSWINPYWEKIKQIVLYRRVHRWSDAYGLILLENSMETGADDNVAALEFPPLTVLAADMNTYTLREYKAMAKLAQMLGHKDDHAMFTRHADDLFHAIREHLWNDEDKIFYNRYAKTGEYIKRISFSSFVPLWEGVATREKARSCIKTYLLSSDHMLSPYGLRTLSKSDPSYNNVNRIKPHSNWQGPVWPIANYLYIHALLRYGFEKEALDIAEKIATLLIRDIQTTGGMHENYNAETGEPLAAPNFVSWNILIANVIDEIKEKRNPFTLD